MSLIHGEACLLFNAALCVCALPLGGRLAGLAPPPPARLLSAARLGGVCGLCGLLPLPSALALCPLAGLPLGVWLCYGARGSAACFRCTVTTLGAGFLTGGVVSMLLERGAPALSALAAALAASMLLYMLITLLPTALAEVRQVELSLGERSVLLPAMLDSGNLLRDPVSGLPVLVAPRRALDVLLPLSRGTDALTELPQGFRLLRVRTAAGGGMMPLFRPDGCRLYLNGRAVDAELLVAVAGREYGGVQALVPLAALPKETPPRARKEEAYEPLA